MTDQFTWHGNTLRGPFALLAGQKLSLPPGPPDSAPLDAGKWWVSCAKQSKSWVMQYGWSSDVPRARDLVLEWRVANPADPQRPAPFGEADEVGEPLAEWPNLSGAFPPGAWDVGEHVAAESEFEMAVECPSLARCDRQANLPAIAANWLDVMLSPEALDVRFVFPATNQTLAASSSILRNQSHYFDTLFAKHKPPQNALHRTNSKDLKCPSVPEWDPSTFKLDLATTVQFASNLNLNSITVTGPTFSTFAAVIVWLSNKYIVFSKENDDAPPPSKRRKMTVPPPGAPTSVPPVPSLDVFALAHTLRIPALKHLALAHFTKGLTVETVPQVLFGAMSAAHGEVREAAMEFAVANWAEVRGSEGMQGMIRKAVAGEVGGGMAVATELLGRICGSG